MKFKKFKGKNYYLFDAKHEILGRMSTEIVKFLTGKNEVHYDPSKESESQVIVINADFVRLSGEKESAKKYWSYSGYPGGIKEEKFKESLKKNSVKVVQNAVKGMMPKNKLGQNGLKRLRIFPENEHDYVHIFKD